MSHPLRVFRFFGTTERSVPSHDRFLDAMPEGEGTYRVFDVNLRQNFYTGNVLRRSLSRSNVLKLNDEELVVIGQMFGCSGLDLKERCRKLLDDYDLKILILTAGACGSYVFSGEFESFVPTPRVEVVDTVGAGDSFTAAFCASLLKGRSPSGGGGVRLCLHVSGGNAGIIARVERAFVSFASRIGSGCSVGFSFPALLSPRRPARTR